MSFHLLLVNTAYNTLGLGVATVSAVGHIIVVGAAVGGIIGTGGVAVCDLIAHP